MTHQIGVDVTAWYTADEMKANGRSFKLGSTHTTYDGKVYVFVQLGTGGVTGDGYVCAIGEDYQAVMLSTSTDAAGDMVGVAEAAGSEDDYGWLQVYGACGIRTEQDALANAKLGATADAGQVDDAGATGSIYIEGMTLGTATGGADAVNTTGFLSWPRQQLVGTYA